MHKSKYILQAVTRSLFGLLLLLAFILIFHSQSPVFGTSENNGNGNSGAIWTTNSDCGDEQQDVNHYSVGETVYIHGEGFDSGSAHIWEIKGQPGGASQDPGSVVASGTLTVEADGGFCIPAYQINVDDWGEYTVDVTDAKKNDNYRVDCKSSCPTPTSCISPSPTATPIPPTPTDRIEDPTPTPEETPDPTPTSEETPNPTPTQTEEEPTPTSTPQPTTTPTPGPTNTPAPGPTNTPGPGPTNTPAPQSGTGGSSNPVVLGITTVAESRAASNTNPLITGIQKSRSKVLGIKTKKLPKTGDNNTETLEKTPSGNQLLVGEYLSIPKLGMVQSLYKPAIINGEYLVGDKEVLVTNNVFYGHNDLAVFGRLGELQQGDEILITTNGQQKAYHIDEIKIIKETDTAVLRNSSGIVLLTCLEENPELRLMIVAH